MNPMTTALPRDRRTLLDIVFAGFAVAGAIALTGCSDKPGKAVETPAPGGAITIPAEQRPKIGVEPVAVTTYRRTLETTGTVAFDADQSTTVLSPISGPVSRLLVSVGASVERGQALAAVSSPDFAAAVTNPSAQ